MTILEWGKNLISFSPRLSLSGQHGIQVVQSYNYKLAQSIVSVLNWGLDLQSAVDMPRWVLVNGNLAMESRFPREVLDDLASRGHTIGPIAAWDGNIARSQLVASTPGGGWQVASDLRGEGVALAL